MRLLASSMLLFAAVALAAVCGGGSKTPERPAAASNQTPVPVYTACNRDDPNCHPPALPTPEALDPAVLSVLAQDSVVRSLVGGGELWKDYWLSPSHLTPGMTSVDILFAWPVSFSGTMPTRSQPCRGHGNEGHVDPSDPCLKETPVAGTTYREFHDQREVMVWVDVERGSVVEVFVPGATDESVDWRIADLTEHRPAIATATPAR